MRWLLSIFLLFPLMAWAGSININTATEAELEGLPGIGSSKAAAIIQYRIDHGAFKTVNDLDNVPGIGPATLANLVPLVTVGDGKTVANGGTAAAATGEAPTAAAPSETAPTTTGTPAEAPATTTNTGCMVNINVADSAALQTLPGIGDSKASAIIQYRTDHGKYASCDGLDAVPGIGPATIDNLRSCCSVK